MFTILKRAIVPTRFDAFCFAIGIQWAAVIVSVMILPAMARLVVVHAEIVLAVSAGTWLAVATTIGWKANSKLRLRILLLSSIASLGFVVAWNYFNAADLHERAHESSFGNRPSSFDAEMFLYELFLNVFWCVLALVVVWVVNWGARKGFQQLKSPFSRLGKLIKNDRTRFLFTAAAGLFVIAIAVRILSAFGVALGSENIGPAIGYVVSSLGCVLFWAVVLFWFPRSFTLTARPVQKAVSLLLVAFICVLVVSDPFQIFTLALSRFTWFIGAFVFVLSVLSFGGQPRQKVAASSESETESLVADRRNVSRPSLFSAVALFGIVILVAVPWCIDLGVLTMPPRRSVTIMQRLELAYEVAKINRTSDGRVRAYFAEGGDFLIFRIQCDEDLPADIFESIGSFGDLYCIELCNLSSGFDLGGLSGQAVPVTLTNCEVSHSQLSDILRAASWLAINGDFSIVDDGADVDPGAISSMNFLETKPGAVADFFGATKCEKQMSYVSLNAAVGDEDWSAVEELAQSSNVFLFGGWARGFQLPKQTRSLKKLHLVGNATQIDDIEAKKDLLLNTDINISYRWRLPQTPEDAWKFLMLRGGSDFRDQVLSIAKADEVFADRAKEIGMAYELEDNQMIRSLYFPWGFEESFGAIPSLKVLSFDTGWVVGAVRDRFGSVPVSFNHLKSLSELEELYFDVMLVYRDLAFLKDLKSLKHLQTPSVVRQVTGPVGFDACQSLESITFLGSPDNQTYREIAKLKKLKRLVIVNFDEDEKLTSDYRDKLAEKLPGVTVQILATSEYESLIPKPFCTYRDRIREELRSDTKWLDEILKK